MGCSTATAPGAALTFSSSEPRTAGVVYPPPPPVARVATSAVTVTGTLVVAAFDYTTTVRGLSPGPLVLRVVHGSGTAPVLDETATIPR